MAGLMDWSLKEVSGEKMKDDILRTVESVWFIQMGHGKDNE